MKRYTHLRDLLIVTLAMLLVFVAANHQTIPLVTAQGSVILTIDNPQQTIDPGQFATFNATITNNTEIARTFNLRVLGLPAGYIESINSPIIVEEDGGSTDFTFSVLVPSDAVAGTTQSGRLEATAQSVTDQPALTAQQAFVITVGGTPPTGTPTDEATPTRTQTPGPTTTRSPVCEDSFEPDNDLVAATVIDVDTTQLHTICPSGDIDWLVFGGVGGKIYTIDIVSMTLGLDLTIELFDDQGRSIAFNDDFFDRPPAENPGDTRPRIQSFTIPYDGQYFIRVRDAANRGNINFFYVIGLFAESYGPTPTNVTELCLDLFEPDGLPEEARLLTSNEIQEDRRLCPKGDADWITFFGKAGKRYIMFTDTRRYRGDIAVNRDTQAGADTVITLTDRDGVSLIDFNDDIPGGNTLDSQIEFTPSVDGFYFLQIKNIGDIGNQFIRYDLSLLLCLPNQTDCGRTSDGSRSTPADPLTPVAPSATPFEEFSIDDPTVTPVLSPTTAAVQNNAVTPVAAVDQGTFADVAFEQVWQRTDQPIAAQVVNRSWMWGPRGLVSRDEPYAQAADGDRLVQYFDKARMEVNPRSGSVTNGLLARELISGAMQVGDNNFVARQPAAVVIAGDIDDPNAPTYASFRALLEEPFSDRNGQNVSETINRAGEIRRYNGVTRAEARLVRFVEQTGHNIPAVFWQFLNAQGDVYENGNYTVAPLMDWLSVVGYPISEPYWVTARVGGEPRDVLVQAFERRVLTYSPDNAPAWQVEMGNVGRHYYQWRYDALLP